MLSCIFLYSFLYEVIMKGVDAAAWTIGTAFWEGR